ncbi:hypothetical protein M5D96_005824, partial [Drosophila gunungcola]
MKSNPRMSTSCTTTAEARRQPVKSISKQNIHNHLPQQGHKNVPTVTHFHCPENVNSLSGIVKYWTTLETCPETINHESKRQWTEDRGHQRLPSLIRLKAKQKTATGKHGEYFRSRRSRYRSES